MNTRLIVIEKTISFEEDISRLLGILLNIDCKKSTSLGFSGGSLSFSQKGTILQDIIRTGAEKEDVDKQKENAIKLTCLLEIRNKFAHVKSIDTFEKLFSTTKVGKKIKNNLEKWYSIDNESVGEEEEKFQYYFQKLSKDINAMIWKIASNYGLQKTKENTKKQSDAAYANAFQQEILSLPDGKKRVDKIIRKVEEEQKKDDSIVQDIMRKFLQ